jgi:hypothetical protein
VKREASFSHPEAGDSNENQPCQFFVVFNDGTFGHNVIFQSLI